MDDNDTAPAAAPASNTQGPEHPTEGGSYVRKPDGALDLVHRTAAAPAPDNRKGPGEPHPEPPAPGPAASEES